MNISRLIFWFSHFSPVLCYHKSMKRVLLLLCLFILSPAYAQLSNAGMEVYSDNNLFGLKDANGKISVEADYKKLIRLGKSSWIAQKRNKYGIMDSDGNWLIQPKYRHVDRMLGKYVKLGNDYNFGVYDENGDAILAPEYSSINLLFGGMFLTCKNYKYGVADRNGNILLENKFDDIYMPKPNIMRIQYNGQWYEVEQVANGEFNPPDDIKNINDNSDFKVSSFISSPAAASGYSAITFTDYLLKLIASISPAHEETIDELMFSQGADTMSIFMRLSWIPKYPVTYAKKYYYYVRTPNNGPLSHIKDSLKQKLH